MRFSINDYSISPKAKGWGDGWPHDRSSDMARVTADRSHTRVNVHKRIARLVDMLLDETERRGYQCDQTQTGGYVNRQIRKTGKSSNHAWGLALDYNWRRNPATFDGKVHSDFPAWVVPLWNQYGFANGGHYRGSFKDPMHFEFMGSPADADDMTAKAKAKLRPSPTAAAVPAKSYTVRNGDTLSKIAAKHHITGGWQALYKLNRAKIGPDPNIIHRGLVLKLP
jgi:D-alanyl-D-alanine carboxypeptidase-like protein/LysM domain-containing protein